jgi:hypothetical protein
LGVSGYAQNFDEETLYRQRLEGAAGGKREIQPREKAERDAGRGASAGQELESRDARPGSPRP